MSRQQEKIEACTEHGPGPSPSHAHIDIVLVTFTDLRYSHFLVTTHAEEVAMSAMANPHTAWVAGTQDVVYLN